MTEVEIPFQPEMRDAILAGRKLCTSRTKSYARRGDTFTIDGARFAIESVRGRKLAWVAKYLYGFEGFASSDEFIAYWRQLHPRAGFRANQTVFVHSFERIPPASGAEVEIVLETEIAGSK